MFHGEFCFSLLENHLLHVVEPCSIVVVDKRLQLLELALYQWYGTCSVLPVNCTVSIG
jgi:hypothetical protein